MKIINNTATMTTEIVCESFADNEHLFLLMDRGIVDLHQDKVTLYCLKEYREWMDNGMLTTIDGEVITEEDMGPPTEVDGEAILNDDDIPTVDEMPRKA